MHPPDCPEWEYDKHPNRNKLCNIISELLKDLGFKKIDTLEVAADTRKIHERMFTHLTPAGYRYYAGHYRGEPYRCLECYRVIIKDDPRVGTEPHLVMDEMALITTKARRGFRMLDDDLQKVSVSQLPVREHLLRIVDFACKLFVDFLTVHPYANGNGHSGRFIVWSVLLRYGYFPQQWPIEPRPPDPPYTVLIRQYRYGDKKPLRKFILNSLKKIT